MDVEKDAETLRIGTIMLRTQCATMFPHVWVMIINGLYQALGRPVEATILGLSRQVIFLIPAAFIMSRVWGVNGLACSQAAADILSLIVSVSMVIYQMKRIKMLKDGDEPPAGYGLAKKMG